MSGFFLSKDSKSSLRRNVESVLLALLLAFTVRAFIFQPFKIPSSSMEPALLVGDYIVVKKFAYGTQIPFSGIQIFDGGAIKRGDVVVFKRAERPGERKKNYFIKRVVATGGDAVQVRGRDIFVNGSKVTQSYAGSHTADGGAAFERYLQRFGEKSVNVIYRKGLSSTYKGIASSAFRVPEGHVFLMGDNRDNSQDSRLWGTVSGRDVVGKAVIVHWSWSFKNSLLPKVRWERIFSEIK